MVQRIQKVLLSTTKGSPIRQFFFLVSLLTLVSCRGSSPEHPSEPLLTPLVPSTALPEIQSTATHYSLNNGETLITPESISTSIARDEVFFPYITEGEQNIVEGEQAVPTLPLTPAPSPTLEGEQVVPLLTLTPASIPTLDFAVLDTQLQNSGQDLAFVKMGFHVTLLEDKHILDNWMQRLDEAGVPFFLKSVDNAEPLYNAQNMIRASGVPHVLVFRRASGGDDGYNWDVPDYNLPPAEAARQHWQRHRDAFPPELDPELVWVETINELDTNRSEWVAEFALETAHLAMADGFRWAAFGWSAGEPELEDWQSPAMLSFLELAGTYPDRLAIALHEGSATIEGADFQYPHRTGRFLQLFAICDQYGIPRPTVLITEWGWAYDSIPPINQAMEDLSWASALYASFPEVKGAAIWMLGSGCCFGYISEQVEKLIDPLTVYALTHYFEAPLLPSQALTDPQLYAP